MLIMQKLSDDHAELDRLCGEMATLIDSPEPCDLTAIATLRWRMARLVTQHLALEDHHIYTPAARDPLSRLGKAAETLKAELGTLYADYQAHIATWPGEKMTAQWSVFRPEALALLARLRARIRRENADLYALVQK